MRVVTVLPSLVLLLLVHAPAVSAAEEWIYLFPAADNEQQQGFARITNLSDSTTTVTVTGIDDAGVTSVGTVSFELPADGSLHFNSQDLEGGNTSKGLTGQLDNGTGSWRLRFSADNPINVMGLFRNATGFVNNIHDTAKTVDQLNHAVPFFNPASNTNKVSRLRLVNTTGETNTFAITGIDDDGVLGDERVFLEVAANAATELTAIDLEQGTSELDGVLGDGAGKWRFDVVSSGEAKVMSLLEDPGGNLSNLSRAIVSDQDGSYTLNYVLPAEAEEQSFLRITNPNATSDTVTITGVDDAGNTSVNDITLELGPRESINFRSEFFESGNTGIGLEGALGNGVGNWRLLISSGQNIDVMSLFRTSSGFLNTLNDNASTIPGTSHEAAFFNPGSNANQVSVIRVNNLSDTSNTVSISGLDDNGAAPGTAFEATLGPLESAEFTAAELEEASLGNGAGKWQLAITTTELSAVQSLMRAPDNFQSNLSTRVNVSDTLKGYFLNGPVAGIGYRSEPSGLSGTTAGDGSYFYEAGDTVTFFIGGIDFPTVLAGPVITPLVLAGTNSVQDSTVVNITRLLHTFDVDGNLDNGINITAEEAALALSQIDFSLSEDAFGSSSVLATLFATLGRDLFERDDSVAQLSSQLTENHIAFSDRDQVKPALEFTYEFIGDLKIISGSHATMGVPIDVNKDGWLDLIVRSEQFDDPETYSRANIYINNGDRTFTVTNSASLLGSDRPYNGPRDVRIFDANLDGELDIYFANAGFDPGGLEGLNCENVVCPGATNTLLLGKASGGFTDVSSTSILPDGASGFTHTTAVADVDGDGDMDIFDGQWGGQTAVRSALRMNRDGVFTETEGRLPEFETNQFFAEGSTVGGTAGSRFCDLDLDGDPDLILGPSSDDVPPVVLENNGRGEFTTLPYDTLPLRDGSGNETIASDIVCEDVDGDGLPDIAYNDHTFNENLDKRMFIRNLGNMTFASWLSMLPEPDAATLGFVTGTPMLTDLNGDNWPDMILGGGGSHPLRILWNEGGTFSAEDYVLFPDNNQVFGQPAVGDFDNDGYMDLFMPGENSSDIFWGGP